MAKERRTKADKQRAQVQRSSQLNYSYRAAQKDTTKVFSTTAQTIKHPLASVSQLFAYDVQLIYRDLIKTVLITTLILGLVMGLKFGPVFLR
jgi:hypothetical protein